MRRGARAWTDDEDALLRQLWPTRLPDKVIEARIGRHKGVIRRRIVDLGLTPHRRALWTREQAEAAE